MVYKSSMDQGIQTPQQNSKGNNELLEWMSPSRPFKKRSKEFYKTAGALVFLVVLVLVFIGEFLLIGVILATFFVMYVLSSVPPEPIKNKITTLGIETAGHYHRWEEMSEFWFDAKYGQKMLVVHLLFGFPTHLQLLLGDVSQEKISSLLSDKVPFKETPERTFLDRASEWLAQKIPLERTS